MRERGQTLTFLVCETIRFLSDGFYDFYYRIRNGNVAGSVRLVGGFAKVGIRPLARSKLGLHYSCL